MSISASPLSGNTTAIASVAMRGETSGRRYRIASTHAWTATEAARTVSTKPRDPVPSASKVTRSMPPPTTSHSANAIASTLRARRTSAAC
jgi:hypothetical protein